MKNRSVLGIKIEIKKDIKVKDIDGKIVSNKKNVFIKNSYTKLYCYELFSFIFEGVDYKWY